MGSSGSASDVGSADVKEQRHGRPLSVLEAHGYHSGEIVGTGTFSTVQKAYSEKHEREVAIKNISKKYVPPIYFETFVPRELKLMKDLDHPYLIKFLQAIETNKSVYIVTELAEKGSLLDLIRKEKYLDELKVCRYLLQILDAVEYCYEKGVVHRDIKLENILLDESDNIKLTDFGLAEGGMFPENGRPRMSDKFCGSYAYASPEVLMGKRHDPYLSDVWSIGVVLYCLVFGSMPFDDSSDHKLVLAVQEKVEFPKHPPVSPDFKALLRGILSPSSERLTVQQIREHSWVKIGTARDKVVNMLSATGDEATAVERITPDQNKGGPSKEQ